MNNSKIIIPLLLLILMFSGCVIGDITENANDVLTSADNILREIDAQVESGKMAQDVATELKSVINEVIDNISSELQDNVGFIFNNANQTMDNAFYNLSSLLITLKTQVLGGTAKELLETTASQVRLTLTQLTGQFEDIVTLVSDKAYVFLDKTTNSIILIVSIVLLAIGVIIFVVVFVKSMKKMTPGGIAGLVFSGIYTAFFICLIVVTPLRAWMITGLSFGQSVDAKDLKAEITAIYPEKFTIGENDRIYIYGRHLNLIENLAVKLQQGTSVKQVFPEDTFIIKNKGQIILGNLGQSSLGWKHIPFRTFQLQVIDKTAALKNSTTLNNIIVEKTDLQISESIKTILKTAITPIAVPEAVREMPSVKMEPMLMTTAIADASAAASLANTNVARLLDNKTLEFFGKTFKITEGLYGLYVYDGDAHIESSHAFEIKYQEPPAPKPDISIVSLSWEGAALKGEKVTPKLRIALAHPKEIKRDFKIRLRSISPSGYNHNLIVKQAEVASLPSSNILTLYFNPYKVNKTGSHSFEVFVDSDNVIAESKENNNKKTAALSAKQYKYSAKVTITKFKPTKSKDGGQDEYRIKVRSRLNAGSLTEWSINKNGEPSNTWTLNLTKTYPNVKPGDTVTVDTSGYEEDGGFLDPHDDLGHDSEPFAVTDTGNQNQKNQTIVLKADGYTIEGLFTITRSVGN